MFDSSGATPTFAFKGFKSFVGPKTIQQISSGVEIKRRELASHNQEGGCTVAKVMAQSRFKPCKP